MNSPTKIPIEELKRERDNLWTLGDKFNDIINYMEGGNTPNRSSSEQLVIKGNSISVAAVKPQIAKRTGTVLERVIDIIRSENKFITRTKIEEIADKSGKPFTGTIITTMSVAKDKPDNELVMVKEGKSAVWGLSSWVDKDMNIINGHKPDDI